MDWKLVASRKSGGKPPDSETGDCATGFAGASPLDPVILRRIAVSDAHE